MIDMSVMVYALVLSSVTADESSGLDVDYDQGSEFCEQASLRHGCWAVGPTLTDELFYIRSPASEPTVPLGLALVCSGPSEDGYRAVVMRDEEEIYSFEAAEFECVVITVASGRTFVQFRDGHDPSAPVSFSQRGFWRMIS